MGMLTKDQAKAALLQIVDAIVEAIEARGDQGTPEGPLYATLMPFGCTLEQFNMFVEVLVTTGKVRKRGNLLFPA
jgi:hypothetical protein